MQSLSDLLQSRPAQRIVQCQHLYHHLSGQILQAIQTVCPDIQKFRLFLFR